MKVQNKPCWVQVVKEIIIGVLLLACPYVFNKIYDAVVTYSSRTFIIFPKLVAPYVLAIVVGIILLALIFAVFKKKISQIGLLIMSILMFIEAAAFRWYGGIAVIISTLFFVFLLGGLILSRTKTFQNQSE